MKRILKLLLVLALALGLIGAPMLPSGAAENGSSVFSDDLRGVILGEGDYRQPVITNDYTAYDYAEQFADQLAALADEQYNAVFLTVDLSARTYLDQTAEKENVSGSYVFYNPVSAAVEAADSLGMQVYLYSPAASGDTLAQNAALFEKAGVDGIILSGSGNTLTGALQAAAAAADVSIGAAYDASDSTTASALAPLAGGTADLILPVMNTTTHGSYAGYLAAAMEDFSGAQVVTINPASKIGSELGGTTLTEDDILYQIYLNHLYEADGMVMDSAAALTDGDLGRRIAWMFASTESFGSAAADMSMPNTLSIGKPTTATMQTTYAKYFISGDSIPGTTLYMNGVEVPRYSSGGAFGILVDLELGENVFTFTQSGQTSKTVRITRYSASGSASTISRITQSSMFPSSDSAVKAGEETTFTCIAPAGASVTATINGQRVAMEQVAAASTGVPATFRGTFVPTSDQDDRTVSAGKVTYTLTYQGSTTSYTSTGNLYVVGEDADFIIRTTTYACAVYEDPEKTIDEFISSFKEGTTDIVVDEKTAGGYTYYQLAMGGWVRKGNTEIVTDTTSVANTIGSASVTASSTDTTKKENYKFSGLFDAPYLVEESADGSTLTFTFYNTTSRLPGGTVATGNFATVQQSSSGGRVTLTFRMKEDLWAWDLVHTDQGTTISLKTKPVIDADSLQPLQGLKIVLDPGHGGTDSGAISAVGTYEKNINLNAALYLKAQLENLGATVYMTRTDDSYSVLDDRLRWIETVDPDLLLSVHHNSVAETVDANKTSGMEIYYYTDRSKELAEMILEDLDGNSNRPMKQAYNSYYYITRIDSAPAMLLELGYTPNPSECEDICSSFQMIKQSITIANSVVKYFE